MGRTEDRIVNNGLWHRYGGKIRARRRIIWLVLCLAYLIVHFHRVSPSVVVNELFPLFHIEAAAVMGSLAASYFYIYSLMQIPAGIMADLFGPRRVVVAGVVVASLGSIWFGTAGSLPGLFAARFLVGLGVSVIFVSVLRVFSTWYLPGEFGTVLGVTLFISNLGGILAGTPLSVLLGLIGYRCTFVAVGLFSLLVAALSWWIVRDRPEDILPDNRGLSGAGPGGAASRAGMLRNFAAVLRDPHLWLALAAAFSIFGPYMAMVGLWGVPYLMQVYGMDRNSAAVFNMIAYLGLMVGAVITGLISDRMKSRKKPYLAFASGNLLFWILMAWWNRGMPPAELLYALFFFLGLCANSCVLSTVMVKEYNPSGVAGLASGIGNVGGFIGCAFMQPFFGYLLDLKWEGALLEGVKQYPPGAFRSAFMVCFLFSCLAVAAIGLLRESFLKNGEV